MYRIFLGLSHVQIFQENYVRYCFFGYPMYRLFLENVVSRIFGVVDFFKGIS